ncbi:MAG: hypothetical protein LN412_08025 [Candidatus Thermoplasmatota archaeon]|nr:hypothetical protein [Candidatus Thermoplasmatota archaeon]
MEIKLSAPDFLPNLDDFLEHMRNARLEFLEAIKSLVQARIDQVKGKTGAKLKKIEVK